MNPELESPFPDGISDETAAALSELLHTLACACENHYYTQLRRYYDAQRDLYDPEQPWRTPPPAKR